VNDIVEQCRREWKRLRVPDSIANEMAAELAADLKEAEADGVSAEDLLGNAATDPRSFAASWADERAVIPQSRSTARLPTRSLILAAIVALTVTTAIGAALVLFASPDASASPAGIRVLPVPGAAPTAVRVRVSTPPPISPDGSATVWVGGDGRVTLAQTGGSGVEIHTVGSILLIVGIIGVIAWLPVLFWSSRTTNDWSGRGTHVGDLPPGPA
jgi:hypothetical protein